MAATALLKIEPDTLGCVGRPKMKLLNYPAHFNGFWPWFVYNYRIEGDGWLAAH
jgi:hypothetical protein